jgi:dTDP-4-dehydrorhamnose reductase
MPLQAILVIGSTGQVGTELMRRKWPAGFAPFALNSAQLDLRDTALIGDVISQGHEGSPWAAVVNAAAYTAVDKAEEELVEAWRINALAPAALAESCARNGVPLLHISTDYVFDGSKGGTREPHDPYNPLNVYGASKLGGELAIRTSGARHAIVRTSWVVSPHGRNFVKTMLRLAGSQSRLQVVMDQRGSPTSAADLAEAVITIAAKLAGDSLNQGGVFHFSNAGETSWAGFATEIFRQSALRGGPYADVEPIPTANFPTPARRPKNSTLGHAAIGSAYGIVPRGWQEALSEILNQLIGEAK